MVAWLAPALLAVVLVMVALKLVVVSSQPATDTLNLNYLNFKRND
jgi:hypothetical protein